jgi:hypothetical protein
MNSEHLSNGALVEALYGATPEPAHLRTCVTCQERYGQLRDARRRFVAAKSEVPDELLTAQRRAIRSGLVRTAPRIWRRLAPAAAGLVIVAAFLVDFDRHAAPSRPAPPDDSKVFQEVFELVSDPAPQPLEPIRTFFEESR